MTGRALHWNIQDMVRTPEATDAAGSIEGHRLPAEEIGRQLMDSNSTLEQNFGQRHHEGMTAMISGHPGLHNERWDHLRMHMAGMVDLQMVPYSAVELLEVEDMELEMAEGAIVPRHRAEDLGEGQRPELRRKLEVHLETSGTRRLRPVQLSGAVGHRQMGWSVQQADWLVEGVAENDAGRVHQSAQSMLEALELELRLEGLPSAPRLHCVQSDEQTWIVDQCCVQVLRRVREAARREPRKQRCAQGLEVSHQIQLGKFQRE